MATVLVNAGLTTFDKILAMNARDLELVSSQFTYSSFLISTYKQVRFVGGDDLTGALHVL